MATFAQQFAKVFGELPPARPSHCKPADNSALLNISDSLGVRPSDDADEAVSVVHVKPGDHKTMDDLRLIEGVVGSVHLYDPFAIGYFYSPHPLQPGRAA
jgi:hypothetical protein